MSRMPPQSQKKRKLEDGVRGKTSRLKKRIRKQQDYHSSSDEESHASASDAGFGPVNLQDSDEEIQTDKKVKQKSSQRSKASTSLAEESQDSDSNSASTDNDNDDDEQDSNPNLISIKKKSTTKRNDPTAFSSSITKILSTKLPQSARHDPLLTRSASAHSTSQSLNQSRLEARAKAHLRAQRKAELDRNRVTDVLGLESGNAGAVAEEEKRLRKIAQRGVVKLFNAVRAAQVRSEEALREEREKGTVGRREREEKAKEMSKMGFLELIGGKRERRKGVEG